MLHLYNTLTRKKELFKPITGGHVLFYHCGPTVYWTQHIGNLRGMTMGDLVVRTFRYFGYDVRHVRNYTDVGHMTSDSDTGEDKMEKGAKREGLSPQQIADKYIAVFENDAKAMNLLDPTVKPRATAYIPEMIAMVTTLLDKGFAYTTDLAIYFDVSKFPTYTELSRQKMDKLEVGAGKAEVSDPQKKHPNDFALWFFRGGSHKNTMQYWDSPFSSPLVTNGQGFPGWHMECSAMTRALLGETIDIHMGGVEHIPVHHTNEIAQSEAANGVKFANYWLHNEHLLVNDKKMAKSEGTGYALAELIDKGFDPLALRYFFLTAHYRSRQNFTWEALGGAQKALTDLRGMMANWKKEEGRTIISEEKLEKVEAFRKKFTDALENDVNVPQALAVVWEVAKSNIPSPDKYDLIREFDQVLGLELSNDELPMTNDTVEIPKEIKELVDKRNALRAEKKFSESDAVRKQIEEQGFVLEDNASGTTVRKQF